MKTLTEKYIEKSRAGKYADNSENRRKHRVGQEYGSKGKTEESGEKDKVERTPEQELEAVNKVIAAVNSGKLNLPAAEAVKLSEKKQKLEASTKKDKESSNIKVGSVVHTQDMKHGNGTVVSIKNGQARVQFKNDEFDYSLSDLVKVPQAEAPGSSSQNNSEENKRLKESDPFPKFRGSPTSEKPEKVKELEKRLGTTFRLYENSGSLYGEYKGKEVRLSDHPSKFTEKGSNRIDLNFNALSVQDMVHKLNGTDPFKGLKKGDTVTHRNLGDMKYVSHDLEKESMTVINSAGEEKKYFIDMFTVGDEAPKSASIPSSRVKFDDLPNSGKVNLKKYLSDKMRKAADETWGDISKVDTKGLQKMEQGLVEDFNRQFDDLPKSRRAEKLYAIMKVKGELAGRGKETQTTEKPKETSSSNFLDKLSASDRKNIPESFQKMSVSELKEVKERHDKIKDNRMISSPERARAREISNQIQTLLDAHEKASSKPKSDLPKNIAPEALTENETNKKPKMVTVRYREFNKQDQPVVKEKQVSEKGLEKFMERLREKDNFYDILSDSRDD